MFYEDLLLIVSDVLLPRQLGLNLVRCCISAIGDISYRHTSRINMASAKMLMLIYAAVRN